VGKVGDYSIIRIREKKTLYSRAQIAVAKATRRYCGHATSIMLRMIFTALKEVVSKGSMFIRKTTLDAIRSITEVLRK